MASKSLVGLAVVLFLASCILQIKGRDVSKLLGAEHKVEGIGNPVIGFLIAMFMDWESLEGTLVGDAKSNKLAGSTTQGSLIKEASDGYTHVAGYQSKGRVDAPTTWHGVRAKISVWNISDVQPLSESSAYIASINNLDGLEFVAAGVHVYPRMYNNRDLRFFTYWRTTKDGIKGCYNDNCPGFVIANGSNLFPGQALAPPLSNYGGETRYITIRIKKDEKTGDWSLYREDKGGPIGGMTLLGWWPQNLFNKLSDRANIIQWTGEVNYQYNETGPSMGSGQFSDEQDGKAASFFGLYGFDFYGRIYNYDYSPIQLVDKPECYDLSPWYHHTFSSPEKSHFFYGGSSGCSQ